jgi:hypothetical protein
MENILFKRPFIHGYPGLTVYLLSRAYKVAQVLLFSFSSFEY